MKKIAGLVLIALMVSACSTSKFSASGTKEKKYVDDFLALMDRGSGPDYARLMACISPLYLKENQLDPTVCKVDNYSIRGYSIESYTPAGVVVTRIWGEDRSWVHELTFQLRIEKGKLYLLPSGHEGGYISPWKSRKTYIKE